VIIGINKWCPLRSDGDYQGKCNGAECALWNEFENNCNINVIADKLISIERSQ